MESIKLASLNLSTDRFTSVRKQSEKLVQPLDPEDTVVQPIVDVSPPKWHLAHSTWFFENFILKEEFTAYKVFHPDYNFLFNSYYETVGERVLRAERGNMTRPSLKEILEYRKHVDEHIQKLLDNTISERAAALLELGLQHEQQHQELLLTDIKYILGHNPLFPSYLPLKGEEKRSAPALKFKNIQEGIYEVGSDADGFSFDNESGKHRVFLEQFSIAERCITNAEFLEFMNDRGYSDFRHWMQEGFEFIKTNKIISPLYWHKLDGTWMQYQLRGGLQILNPDEPVTHLSFYEADAYARWSGKRLPTEFEWEISAKNFSSEEGNFSGSELYKSRIESGAEFLGNIWEWTNSAYLPYPNYKKDEGALGEYNGKFMINQMVLRGGSCATPGSHIRLTYRNFFHTDKRWQFSGIRLASDK